MILLSNIIKARYVVYDSSEKKETNIVEPITTTISKEELFDIYNQREIILKEAEEEAAKIINAAIKEARLEAEGIKKKGYEDGYNAGMEAGKNKGYIEGYAAGQREAVEILEEQSKEKLNELAEMIKLIEKEKLSILSKFEQDITRLALDIAEKIIRNEVDTKDNVVLSIIKDLINDYRKSEWIKIYISGKDDVLTLQGDQELMNMLNKISKDVKIEVLDELEKGSAIIETEDGIVEASIETQLKNLREMVLSKNAG